MIDAISPFSSWTPAAARASEASSFSLEDVSREKASPAPAGRGAPPPPPPAQDASEDAEVIEEILESEEEEQSLLERILEVGFRAYAEEIRAEKIQELREKILESMGLTEEELEKMPPDQRAQVENLVAHEMAKRMAAQAEMNSGDEASQLVQMTSIHSRTVALTMTQSTLVGSGLDPVSGSLLNLGPGGMGLGPLLALQEIDAGDEAGAVPPRPLGKNDRVEG